MSENQPTLLPSAVRTKVAVAMALLLLAGIVGLMWRGPAILLDLAAFSNMIWCF